MNTNINIRTDSELKSKASKLFKGMGLDLSSAINIFLNQCVLEDGIPFRITRKVPNRETEKAMQNVIEGKNLSKGFDNVDELFESLGI